MESSRWKCKRHNKHKFLFAGRMVLHFGNIKVVMLFQHKVMHRILFFAAPCQMKPCFRDGLCTVTGNQTTCTCPLGSSGPRCKNGTSLFFFNITTAPKIFLKISFKLFTVHPEVCEFRCIYFCDFVILDQNMVLFIFF